MLAGLFLIALSTQLKSLEEYGPPDDDHAERALTLHKINPLQTPAFEGTMSSGSTALFQFTSAKMADSFIDVVVKLHTAFVLGEPQTGFEIGFTSDPEFAERLQRDTQGTAEAAPHAITGGDIFGAVIMASQQSALCQHCRRVQVSAKHTSSTNSTHWIVLRSDKTAVAENVAFTLYVNIRPRFSFIVLHCMIFLFFGILFAWQLIPMLMAIARAQPAAHAAWPHFYFDQLLSLPFVFVWKGYDAVQRIAFLWRRWTQERMKGTPHEKLIGSLESISTTEQDFNAPSCRICRDTAGQLITPCQCSGSMAYVHRECLDRWRTECFKNDPRSKKVASCDVCLQPFEDSVQFKPGDLLQRFMHAQAESVGILIVQIFSFWLFLFVWSLVIRFVFARAQCSAPWDLMSDASLYDLDALLQSFFIYAAFYWMYYIAAFARFLANGGEGRLYTVQNALLAAMALGSFCYTSALLKFLAYLRSEMFVWDYELKLMPGLPIGLLSTCLFIMCARAMMGRSVRNSSADGRSSI